MFYIELFYTATSLWLPLLHWPSSSFQPPLCHPAIISLLSPRPPLPPPPLPPPSLFPLLPLPPIPPPLLLLLLLLLSMTCNYQLIHVCNYFLNICIAINNFIVHIFNCSYITINHQPYIAFHFFHKKMCLLYNYIHSIQLICHIRVVPYTMYV